MDFRLKIQEKEYLILKNKKLQTKGRHDDLMESIVD